MQDGKKYIMLKRKRIASIVLNPFTHDSRVEKEALCLAKKYELTVFALWAEGLPLHERRELYAVERLKLKTKKWSKNKLIQLIKYFELIYRFIKCSQHIDIYHCHDLHTLPIGIISKYSKNRKAKIVYDAHEHETEVDGLSKSMKKITKVIEKILIKFVDKTITVSDSIADDYQKLYNIKKPVIIYNTPINREVKKNNYFREKFNISKNNYIYIFQGALVSGRGVEEILETFKQCSGIKRNIVFLGYGNLVPLIKKYEEKFDNIWYHEAVAPHDLLNYTVSADFGLTSVINQGYCKSYDYSLPNKLFEYVMAELPMIVTLPEMTKFVLKYKIGVKAKSNNYSDLIKAFEEIEEKDIQEMKKNIQQVKRYYSWENQEELLLSLYKELDAN